MLNHVDATYQLFLCTLTGMDFQVADNFLPLLLQGLLVFLRHELPLLPHEHMQVGCLL